VSPPPHIPTYRWHGTDARGQPQQGTLQASDIELARALLRREGIRVQQLERQWWSRQKPLSGKTITSMTRQWAALIRAGVSLVPALQMLQRSATQPTLARLLEEVRQDVESGLALSQALDRHPQAFGPLYVSMVHAGESAGILDTMMERLAQTLEKNEKLRSRVRAALTYPVVVTVLALAVLVLMLMYVVPVFEEVFQSFGAELPWSTRAVLTLSQAVSHGAPWAALLALPMLALLRRQWQQPALQRQWHRRVLGLPGVGDLVRTSVLARWAHTLSALLEAGVPLTEALPVAGRATGHPVYERINEHLQRRVAQGGRLSEGMAHTGRFPDMLVQLCATGEESGTLGILLGKAAELMTEELDARVQALSSLIEPLIIVVLGGAIGVILVAMYLPIFRLGQVF
jgi:type IV pilus assembly protein PilC